MKKKAIIALTTASLVFSTSFINSIHNSQVYASEQEQEQGQDKEQNVEKLKEKIEKSKEIELSLEDIITLATVDNTTLARLHYEYKLLDLNKDSLYDQIGTQESTNHEIHSNIREMRSQIQQLESQRDSGELTEEEIKVIDAQIKQLRDSVSSLMSQADSIGDAIKRSEIELLKIENQLEQEPLQRKNAEEGVRLMIQSTYTGLLQMQDGIKLQEKQLQLKQKELQNQERRYKLGLLSKHDLTKVKRDYDKLQEDVKQLKEQFDLQLNNLLLELNISTKNKKFTIKQIELDKLPKVRQSETTDKLIENSIEMQLLKQELETVEKQYEQSPSYLRTLKEQYEINVELTKLNLKQKQVELEKKVNDLYLQANHAYEKLKLVEKETKYKDEDYQKLTIQYQLGLISKYDFEQASMIIDVANNELKQAQINYYLIKEQINALERGFIS